jgi:hypothetical protein
MYLMLVISTWLVKMFVLVIFFYYISRSEIHVCSDFDNIE